MLVFCFGFVHGEVSVEGKMGAKEVDASDTKVFWLHCE